MRAATAVLGLSSFELGMFNGFRSPEDCRDSNKDCEWRVGQKYAVFV
jgi:hypothetical protein